MDNAAPASSNSPVESAEDHLRFESLVASICSKLVHATPANIDAVIADALRQIAGALGGNRVLLGQTNERTQELIARSQFRTTDPPFPERLSINELNPALWRTLAAGEVSAVADVSALPDSATTDREYFSRIGLRSYLAVPVLIDGSLRFMLAVGNVGERRHWPQEAVPRLRVLAEVLAIALLRCESERVLRANEKLFRAFVEQAPVPIMLAPGTDGAPLYFNPEFSRIFGYSREDIPTPADWWPRAYPDEHYRQQRMAGWQALIALVQKSGQTQAGTEAEMHRKNGAICYADIRLAMIEGYKLIFFSDLTARREMEKALRLTQYAVDQSPTMIFRIDHAGRFVYANEAALRRFGWSPAEMATHFIWDVSATITAADWPQRAFLLLEEGGTSLESVFRRKDGNFFPVEVHIHAMEFSGAECFFCFALDISVRKQAQEDSFAHLQRIKALAAGLSRAEEQQRRETAQMLHDEIGQDLFAVTAQLIALRNRSPADAETLTKSLNLLDQITRHTRELTFELCPPELSQVGLSAAIARLAEMFGQRHHLEILLEGSGEGPTDLNIRGLAYNTVRELLFNVAKHAHATRVRILYAEKDGRLYMDVIDNGVGYNKSVPTKSPGFGLFYLRQRIELLGGRLQMDGSQAGCRVSVEIPLESHTPE